MDIWFWHILVFLKFPNTVSCIWKEDTIPMGTRDNYPFRDRRKISSDVPCNFAGYCSMGKAQIQGKKMDLAQKVDAQTKKSTEVGNEL